MPHASLADLIRARPWAGYLFAGLVVVAVHLLRIAFADLLEGYPFILATVAVTLVAFVAGTGPGFAAAALLGVLTKYFFIPPLGTLVPAGPGGVIGMLFYIALSTTIVLLIGGLLRARASLAAANARLEEGAAEGSAALGAEMARRDEAQAQVRQMQKMEAVGQLTGGVAHDFNNLLTVIRGSVDLLRRPDLSEEKRHRYIDAIGETADRAARLTSQLLAFARRQALTPELFDVGAGLAGIGDMVRTLTGSRVVFHTELPEVPCPVLADRGQFDTALVNMAVNARDAMAGEGRLTIAAGPVSGVPAIRTHPPVAGAFVAITVSDTGQGIAADDLDRIFEPFFTTKGVGEGTGLGLSQVIGFAKQSGGDIRVDSVAGEGTTFTLYLPRAEADAEAEEADGGALPSADVEGVCVLVVEDNERVGEFATQALRELGYDSVLARDAEHALAELAQDCARFHVVFSDVVMPGRSGLELGQDVRRLYPDVPIILTSGYSHVLAQNGAHGFELLHKPYSVDQLSRVLGKALAWQRRRAGVTETAGGG